MGHVHKNYSVVASAILKQLIVDSNKEEFKDEIREQLHDLEYTEYWRELADFADIDEVEFFRILITNVGAE